MTIRDRLRAAWRALRGMDSLPAVSDVEKTLTPLPMRISETAQANAAYVVKEALTATYALPTAAPGVIANDAKLACDSAITDVYAYAINGVFAEGLVFPGYALLSEYSQRPEYRRPCEILAKEMTRKWIKLQASGEEDKSDKIKIIEAELKRLGAQKAFQKAAEQDGYFGRSQIYLDCGNDDPDELKLPLATSKAKLKDGTLKRLTVVEPIWTYPDTYNSSDPLKADFFKPTSWFVMGKKVHATRLLTFVSRPVPDLLKPAYAFGGVSLSQLAKPYVDNWLRTRQSISDLIHAFSVFVLKTNMAGVLTGDGGEQMFARAQLFNATRDNRGLMMLDKDTEEFENVSARAGDLDKLQAQSQEHMAAVNGIPLIVLLGITPAGLNATAEPEIRVFYDWIHSKQESDFTPNLSQLVDIIQIEKFGEIDPEIGFIYEPLWDLDATELATVRKTDAETDDVLINAGVIDPGEARARLAGEEDSPYAGLDLNKVIEPPADPSLEPNPLEPDPGEEDTLESAAAETDNSRQTPTSQTDP